MHLLTLERQKKINAQQAKAEVYMVNTCGLDVECGFLKTQLHIALFFQNKK
jgi:hypothetical protein